MRLYYHKTDGGAEYLCSSNVEGTDEGSFDSKYIVRIDGNIRKDAELLIKEDVEDQCHTCHVIGKGLTENDDGEWTCDDCWK